jgi:glycosyltransferase involved in cell wall biosynthesis
VNRLRVVHVAAQLNTGGLERLLVEFARHGDADRFELQFVSLGDRGTVAAEIEAAGWRVTALQQPQGVCPALIWRLARLFRDWRADLVHAHNLRPLIYAAPAARLARARLVHTRHGQQYGAGVRAGAQLRLASGLADGVVCVSREGAQLSRRQGVAAHKLRVVHNGIDLSRFDYAGPQQGGPAVMIGRLSPEKDAQNLIRAMAIVTREVPAFRLEIAGDGRCKAGLSELARELGVEKQVRFLGEVRDVAALLGQASMFVLPSKTEGISLTLLEAMARGLPVIATRVGGTPEVIEQERSGVMVAAQSPAELAAAMLRVYRDPASARGMGLAAHQGVVERFDVRRMVDDYENLYLQCAAGRQSSNKGASAIPKFTPIISEAEISLHLKARCA